MQLWKRTISVQTANKNPSVGAKGSVRVFKFWRIAETKVLIDSRECQEGL